MDRAGADFRVVEQRKAWLKSIPIQVPIGAEENFKGVIDLIRMKAINWNEEDLGSTYVAEDIPEDLLSQCEELREQMIEAAAEANEDLLNEYLENGELSEDQIKRVLGLEQSIMKLFRCMQFGFQKQRRTTILDAVIYLCHHRLTLLILLEYSMMNQRLLENRMMARIFSFGIQDCK